MHCLLVNRPGWQILTLFVCYEGWISYTIRCDSHFKRSSFSRSTTIPNILSHDWTDRSHPKINKVPWQGSSSGTPNTLEFSLLCFSFFPLFALPPRFLKKFQLSAGFTESEPLSAPCNFKKKPICHISLFNCSYDQILDIHPETTRLSYTSLQISIHCELDLAFFNVYFREFTTSINFLVLPSHFTQKHHTGWNYNKN